MQKNTRQGKVAGDIEKVVADFLNKNVATLFPAVIISVVRCEVSSDLSNAKIFVSIYDLSASNDNEKIFHTILSKASLARREVAKLCNLKYTPMLNFIYDTNVETDHRIDDLLAQLKKSEQ